MLVKSKSGAKLKKLKKNAGQDKKYRKIKNLDKIVIRSTSKKSNFFLVARLDDQDARVLLSKTTAWCLKKANARTRNTALAVRELLKKFVTTLKERYTTDSMCIEVSGNGRYKDFLTDKSSILQLTSLVRKKVDGSPRLVTIDYKNTIAFGGVRKKKGKNGGKE